MAHSISSAVWGGTLERVTAHHGQDVRGWNPDCSWYQYATAYCMNGCQHPGMDIGISYVNLYAARSGTVTLAGFYDFFRPYHVQIRSASGEIDIYGHMWSIDSAIVEGGTVAAGQFLGISGQQTIRGTMTPDGTDPHLHFETRRPSQSCSSGFAAIDPEPVLTGAGGTPPPAPNFSPTDLIQVTQGPLNLRSSPSTSSSIVASLASGTRMCVIFEPTVADGYTWYAVGVQGTQTTGYVAGEFCGLVAAEGCRSTPTFSPADLIEVDEGPLNLRSSPSTSSEVRRSLATGTRLCVIFDPTSADGYTWYAVGVQGTQDTGYVAGEFCRLVTAGGCS